MSDLAPLLEPAQLQAHVDALLQEKAKELDTLTPKTVRAELEQRLGYSPGELDPMKKAISLAIQEGLKRVQKEDLAASEAALSSASAAAVPAAVPAAASSSSSSSSRSASSKKRSAATSDGEDEEDAGGAAAAAAAAAAAPAKRARASDSGGNGSGASGGDQSVFPLGANKRVEVRMFKSMVLVDIREMYIDKVSGEERPGSKGISLKPEQWEAICRHSAQISQAVERMQR